MYSDNEGILYLEDTDPVAPLNATLNALQAGTSDTLDSNVRIWRVANISERDALATTFVPSTTKPLVVWRQDALETARLEISVAGTDFRPLVDNGTWTEYTPNLTASGTNPSLGSGFSRSGRYVRRGGTVEGYFSIQFGSSMGRGSGNYRIAAPVPIHNDLLDSFMPVGTVRLRDDSAPTERLWSLITVAGEPNVFEIRATGETGATPVTHVTPWSWSTNDRLRGWFSYRPAT